MLIRWVWLSSQWNGLSAYRYVWWEARLMVPLDGNGCPGCKIACMGGWAGIGTKVQRWMVIGIKGLWAQSDRMLSIGDGWCKWDNWVEPHQNPSYKSIN